MAKSFSTAGNEPRVNKQLLPQMSLAGVELTSDAPPPHLSTRTNTFASLMHEKYAPTITNLQISTPGVMDRVFPVSTPREGPIYREREKSAMEKAAVGSTLSSAFISARATGTTPAAASGPPGRAPRAAGRGVNANTDIVTRGVPIQPMPPRRAGTRPTNIEGASHLLPLAPLFHPLSLFPLTITSYLDGPHFSYDKTSAFNCSTPVTPESYQTLLMNECPISEINIGRNVSFFL